MSWNNSPKPEINVIIIVTHNEIILQFINYKYITKYTLFNMLCVHVYMKIHLTNCLNMYVTIVYGEI